MKTEPRTLRNTAQAADRNPRQPTERQAIERDRIRNLGQALLARHGTHTITTASLAAAIGMATTTLRRYFCDIDALLADLLRRHLHTLAAAIGQIPRTDPDCRAKRIAAYIEHTRTPLGGFTEPHLLLVRDRLQLPPDELQSIEETRYALGEAIAGPLAEEALGLLDLPCFDANRIQSILDHLPPLTLPQLAQAPAPQPAPPAPEPAAEPAIQPPAEPIDWREPPPPADDDFLAFVGRRGPLPPNRMAEHLNAVPVHASG